MERETGLEPATSSLGIQTYVGSKSLARFCCEFLNLQRLAASAFSRLGRPNEAQTRHVLPEPGHVSNLCVPMRPPQLALRSPSCAVLRATVYAFRTFLAKDGSIRTSVG